uniref:ENT domain-containing protein n=1 Tax=Chlamydomonas leiostraca TaxID=1034604 RepID=A0A7S0RH94_9CHLO|mmetsp:Transcript_22943/g.58615  ORF Transcript_22943/g.58615 Transcript_22943/m.58615 type:complete len:249 (+) Transcript_22943:91-837(+)
MSYGLLSPNEVADRRQALNDEAFFSILKAFQAQGASLPLALGMKLRKELNISAQQQKLWHDELKHAHMSGHLYQSQLSRTVSAPYGEMPVMPAQPAAGGRGRKGSQQQPSLAQQQTQQAYLQQQQALLQQQQQRMQQAAYAQQQPYTQQPQQQQQPQRQQQAAEAIEELDGVMIGYKVNYYWSQNRVWQEGVITRYIPPNICITFHMGSQMQTDEWIKWEQSPHLQMKDDRVDMTVIQQYRASKGLYP